MTVELQSSPPELKSIARHSRRCFHVQYESLCHCFRLPSSSETTGGGFFVFCCLGLVVCFGLYAFMLEQLTIDGHGPNEFLLMLISCIIYSALSYIGRVLGRERIDTAPWYVFLILSFTTFCSSYLSVLALRYVSYIFRVLGKTCKPIPIMALGLIIGKHYPLRKYVSVILVTLGAILFFVFQNKTHRENEHNRPEIGALLVLLSLCFDGATGVLEEKFMKQYQMGPFTMMHKINCFSVLIAGTLVLFTSANVTNEELAHYFSILPDLLMLGITGGCGQMFIFLMISRFGALMTSIAGTARKILTMAVSIAVFGHNLALIQYFGLFIAVSGMLVNLYRGPPKEPLRRSRTVLVEEEEEGEQEGLLSHQDDDEEEIKDAQPTNVFSNVNENFEPKPEAPYGVAIDIAFRATTAA
ncbi:Drug/Metabolite Transporter (DMT) Superfamily [Thraustotheca clavata]|uniref:Drug/Metabolite Transporter (DMT) Superfamily n=1 Tax=Thraustotheca clavata TaxID=74557 RepID=A0A1W0ACL7_9STRA|nr:Drug/Metabolite Transporter (DMT) Superfamily [Thraustotheca clavata]